MNIQSFYESDSGTWTHLLADPSSGAAAVIDPVWVYNPVSGMADTTFIEGVLDTAERAGYRIEWVLETHAHADHLTAADQVRRLTGAKIACGKRICGVQENFVKVFNMQDVPVDGSQFDRLLAEGEQIDLGNLGVRVMETPGHTSDSVTYLAGDAAFVGDTLFAPSLGTARCDFPGGEASLLYDSVQRLYQLPPYTRLYLCHDYPEEGEEPLPWVTVEDSRRDNIQINAKTTKAIFVAMRTERDAKLGLPKLILPSLQVNILAGVAPEADDNGVSYLRTPLNRTIADLIKEP